jgi:glycosyltransferase involved in cell wall biosynthesis
MKTRSVVLIGTYPPTRCGIATFTENLRQAMVTSTDKLDVGIVRVVKASGNGTLPEVAATWETGNQPSLHHAVNVSNASDCVVLQHEFGIYGGPDGVEVLDLASQLSCPLISVLHTVPMLPSPLQREILEELVRMSSVAVAQSEVARQRLLGFLPEFNATPVVSIPHGAAENFDGPRVFELPSPSALTWGLLGPGKGVEHGIDAIARLRTAPPPPTYVVSGTTHPRVWEQAGDSYLESLRQRSRRLDVEHLICFDSCYHDWASLRALVRAADVVLIPYESMDQVTSGVLVEALASGKPVVATRFPHAVELLSDGAGIVVDHADPVAIAEALFRVLYVPGVAEEMSHAARCVARRLLWPTVGSSYVHLVDHLAALELSVA